SSISAVGNTIVSDEGNVVDEWLAQYAFRTLYETKDTEATLNRLLEIIGRSFDVSRVYVFESSKDKTQCSNTFEWCAEGVSPQIDKLQNIAYIDELGDYLTNFDEHGLFYCHDIESLHPDVYAVLKPQSIYSLLQCAMLDEGEFVGYVGFDECRENRAWTERQIASFKLTANVISTFIIKLRQKQNKERNRA
ncbi:MAG: GAF domain-containing protein, partial [Coprobacillus sp.]